MRRYPDIGTVRRITICGTGAGGLALAHAFVRRGKDVTLASLDRPTAATALVARQGFTAREGKSLTHHTVRVTTDSREAFLRADAVAIVAPAAARRRYVERVVSACAPHVPIVLIPGGLAVGLSCSPLFRERGFLETNEFPCVARLCERDVVDIHYTSSHFWAGAYPTEYTDYAVSLLEDWFGFPIAPTDHTIHCGLMQWNMILHPPIAYTNLSRIEKQEDFAFYRPSGGMTPAVAAIMESLDGERLAVGRALSLTTPSLKAYLAGYPLTGIDSFSTLYDAVTADASTEYIRGPISINHRYLQEDIPYGLMPLSALGRALNVRTPMTDAFITFARSLYGDALLGEGTSCEAAACRFVASLPSQ